MTAEDEIRMQAFMIGNGNYSIPSFTIFFFGALLLPDLWLTFYSDFKKGRQTIPISKWTINDFAYKQISELRTELAKTKRQKIKLSMKKIAIVKLGGQLKMEVSAHKTFLAMM